MSEPKITRRRAMTVLAAAAATLPLGGWTRSEPFEWRGAVLGADARVVLYGRDAKAARETVKACLLEVERLESIFSLYRPDSEISRLNRTGFVEAASLDMCRLLHMSRLIHRRSEGAFDPTVQSLWRFYAEWFSRHGDRPPSVEMIRARRANIGMHRIEIDGGAIRMVQGTEVTLNSIAQGYITDRVADLLRARGWSHVLLDLGEVRALDGRPDGRPWQIQLRDSKLRLPLATAALATSSGAGFVFSCTTPLTHILDPATGTSPRHWRSITVRHRSAALADALSTSLIVAPPRRLARLLGRFPGTRAWAMDTAGRTLALSA